VGILALTGERRAVKHLVGLVTSDKEPLPLRVAVLWALAEIGDPRGIVAYQYALQKIYVKDPQWAEAKGITIQSEGGERTISLREMCEARLGRLAEPVLLKQAADQHPGLVDMLLAPLTKGITPEKPPEEDAATGRLRAALLSVAAVGDRSLTAVIRHKYGFSLWGKHLALMRFTQGCVGRCDFCPSWAQTGKRYLRRSVESMLAELSTISEPYIYFVCEESLLDTRLSLALAQAIRAEGIKKRFGMPLRADTIVAKPEVIEAWVAAGLEDTIVGIEQASDEDLQDRDKTTRIGDNIEAMKILKANGVSCTGSMFFRPDFGKEQFDRLIAHTIELQVDCPQYFVLTPIPGTKLYEKSKHQLVEHDFDLWDFNHAVTPTRMPLRDFYEQYMLAYRTHLEPFVVELYRKKLGALTEAELAEEMAGLLGFREVFGTLHEDHKEYSGPVAESAA
jgi:radical SAM superfamily enzyme YgiQ (UPF0313 family)